MDSDILHLTLAALALALTLNFKLSLSVLRAIRNERELPAELVVGQPIQGMTARTLVARAPVQLVNKHQATVLLFLSSRCPTCKSTLPELERMLPAAQQAGLTIWLVSLESAWRLRRFLRSPSLLAHVARLRLDAYRTLNPRLSAPAYLFVSHEGVLEASGKVGDENWMSLRAQLTQHDSEQPT